MFLVVPLGPNVQRQISTPEFFELTAFSLWLGAGITCVCRMQTSLRNPRKESQAINNTQIVMEIQRAAKRGCKAHFPLGAGGGGASRAASSSFEKARSLLKLSIDRGHLQFERPGGIQRVYVPSNKALSNF